MSVNYALGGGPGQPPIRIAPPPAQSPQLPNIAVPALNAPPKINAPPMLSIPQLGAPVMGGLSGGMGQSDPYALSTLLSYALDRIMNPPQAQNGSSQQAAAPTTDATASQQADSVSSTAPSPFAGAVEHLAVSGPSGTTSTTTAPATTQGSTSTAPTSDEWKKIIANHPEVGQFQPMIQEASQQYGVDPALVVSIIQAESGGDPMAQSGVGAKGLMQLMDGTAQGLGVTNPFDPKQNINGGVKFLSGLIQQFGGNLTKAIAAYNAGPGAVQQYGGVPPFTETQTYVTEVLNSYNALKGTGG